MELLSATNKKEPIAVLDRACKRFGRVTALDELDLRVHRGEVLAVLGPNGAGKTTAISVMLGVLQPDRGQARLFGRHPKEWAARARTGVMLQISGVPETLKVIEHIRLFSSYYPNPMTPEETVEAAGLQGLEGKSFGKLSGGQKQRVLFALAICGRPKLLFLDEPTVGLDVEARRFFWRQIRSQVERGCGVVLTTHYLEEADALADRIVVIDSGRTIADGTPQHIKSRVAGRRIRCRTRLSTEQIQAIPQVASVRTVHDMVEVFTNEAERTLRCLLEMDESLSQLEVTGAGLEEAFLSLTRGQRIEEEVAV